MLRILLVNDTDKPIGELREALSRAGYAVVAEVDGAAALLRAVEELSPDVVIIDTESPSRDTLEQLAVMGHAAPRPVVMFADRSEPQAIRDAVGAGVTAYVVDHVTADRLAPIIEVALVRFEEEARLRKRLADAEQRLAERKLIDRAKGILMDKRGLSETEAYETLRRQAMRQGERIAEVARQLIAMADLLG
ncbi:ANTAR domain-containing protein [Crenobacter sp. SG2305]|uniref:ANTAR domain-containing response regulator n=1 Tax=Crenobacter oryzisoli TaxID=3056844 RepID=UPI0025AA375A|nr:ANTAR domain-containing protein [Crenobacter sp. SG2305]MDN0082756.1 ANTAR domain-containing protein [Crenobacter sp. SG2305]